MIMLTIDPVGSSQVELPSGFISIIQNNLSFNVFYYSSFNSSDQPVVDYYAYNFSIKTTLGLIANRAAGIFDPRKPFEVILRHDGSSAWRFSAPAISNNNETPTSKSLSGSLSGTWYDPKRSGEGALIELGETDGNKVLTFSWYTWDENNNGAQSWMIGTSEYKSGATEAKLGLFKGSGGKFGADFNSSQVKMNQWGEATISFPVVV